MKASDAILEIQRILNIPEDQRSPHVGPVTKAKLSELAALPPDAEWPVPAPAAPSGDTFEGFPRAAIDLILDAESIDQPSLFPGGGSGVSLGYGCDIGADPGSLEFWRGILTDDRIDRLSAAKGLTGQAAKQICGRFADIRVTKQQSLDVFLKTSLPREIALTKRTFPGIDTLPPQVLGAMTSIVYNRGSDMDGDRRLEMRAIREIISGEADRNSKLRGIAQQIVAMKRLWVGAGVDGLLARRDREAALVRSAITA